MYKYFVHFDGVNMLIFCVSVTDADYADYATPQQWHQ